MTDTADNNALVLRTMTDNFDDIPSVLALATLPAFATSWSGMGGVYLETNGMSTVDDPSGSVQVDVPPPPGAPNTAKPPATSSIAAEGILVRALLDAAQKRHAQPDAVMTDILGHATKRPPEGPDLPD